MSEAHKSPAILRVRIVKKPGQVRVGFRSWFRSFVGSGLKKIAI